MACNVTRRLGIARLADAINVQSLPRKREFCFGSYSCNHFSSSGIIPILDVVTSQANQVYVGFYIRIKPCLTFWETQFLDQPVFP